jgi:hypothetical protein
MQGSSRGFGCVSLLANSGALVMPASLKSLARRTGVIGTGKPTVLLIRSRISSWP